MIMTAPAEAAISGCICPQIYAPVICDKGKTYPNQCLADCRNAKNCRPTGEIWTPELAAQYPDRDWILTRILWLSGTEVGRNRLGNVDTMRRYIYIHGMPDTEPLGDTRSKAFDHDVDLLLAAPLRAGRHGPVDPGERGAPADDLGVRGGPVAAAPGEEGDRLEQGCLAGSVGTVEEVRTGPEGRVERGVAPEVPERDRVEQ